MSNTTERGCGELLRKSLATALMILPDRGGDAGATRGRCPWRRIRSRRRGAVVPGGLIDVVTAARSTPHGARAAEWKEYTGVPAHADRGVSGDGAWAASWRHRRRRCSVVSRRSSSTWARTVSGFGRSSARIRRETSSFRRTNCAFRAKSLRNSLRNRVAILAVTVDGFRLLISVADALRV